LCFNVLEHIAEDAKALGNLTYLLRRGGICAFFFLLSLFYSRKWTHWRDIIRRYTKTSLRALVANLPLKVVKMEYFNVIGGIGWWINKYIRKESLNDSAINIQIKIFDKYIVPFSKRLQPLARHLFGQSLACILRKV
jgi:c-di-AMP phosphodiesterase-like protein